MMEGAEAMDSAGLFDLFTLEVSFRYDGHAYVIGIKFGCPKTRDRETERAGDRGVVTISCV